MDTTKKPTAFAQNVVGFGLFVAGLWTVEPLLVMLRVGLGSQEAGGLFAEAIGRGFISLLGLGALSWVLEKITGTKAPLDRVISGR